MYAYLSATRRGAVNKNPLIALVPIRARAVMRRPVVGVERSRSEVRGGHGFANEVRFADPAALRVRQDDGDRGANCAEFCDEGVDVGRGDLRGRAVVVYDLGG